MRKIRDFDFHRVSGEPCTWSAENIKRKAIIEQLILGKYDSDPVKAWKNSSDKSVDEEEPVTDETEPKKVVVKSNEPDYEYLMGMALWSLTEERKEELLKKRDAKVFPCTDVVIQMKALLF